jgi:ankyrin repeat protein
VRERGNSVSPRWSRKDTVILSKILRMTVQGFYLSIINGFPYTCETLLSQGMDPNTVMENNNTFLHIACENTTIIITNILLMYGADANIQNSNNKTPLHIASMYGESQMVRILIRFMKNINVRDECGKTPLFLAANTQSAYILMMNGGKV